MIDELAARKSEAANAFVKKHAKCPRRDLVHLSFHSFVIAYPDGSSSTEHTIACTSCLSKLTWHEMKPPKEEVKTP